MLNRHEISKLLELLHRHLDGMKPHKNESEDLFEFRRQPFFAIVTKLDAMWREAKPSVAPLARKEQLNDR